VWYIIIRLLTYALAVTTLVVVVFLHDDSTMVVVGLCAATGLAAVTTACMPVPEDKRRQRR
jgi:hypothetical protein